MRIALVVHDFQRDIGQGRYTFELARRFAREHEVHVFANAYDPAGADGVQFHHVPALRTNALSTILSFVGPATARVGSGWDIVHAQGLTTLRFNVITAHICNASWARAQRALGFARTWRQELFERVVTPLERATYRRSLAAETIAISRHLKQELAEIYNRRDRVSVIHHGVDVDSFSPAIRDQHRAAMRASLGFADADFVALFVGDLRKGAATALEAAALVPGLRLMLVSRSASGPYAARGHALGIGTRVAFHPATADIARYYAAADAFVFPSPYDAFGMVVTEAMAMGLPVITSRQAGASEIIEHGVSGFIDDASDHAGFAAHLHQLMHDAQQRRSVAIAARDAAVRNTWDGVAAATMTIYRRATRLQ